MTIIAEAASGITEFIVNGRQSSDLEENKNFQGIERSKMEILNELDTSIKRNHNSIVL